jgi:hypothetical protein
MGVPAAPLAVIPAELGTPPVPGGIGFVVSLQPTAVTANANATTKPLDRIT